MNDLLTLENIPSAALVAELMRRGYEVYKWDYIEWDIPACNATAPQPQNKEYDKRK